MSAIASYFLPDLTVAEELTARSYYALTTFLDLAQTVAKVARSIFFSSIACLCFGQSHLLNQTSLLSWKDTAFSFQLSLLSLLGVLSPRTALLKKIDAHTTNILSPTGISFVDLLFIQDHHSLGLKAVLAGQMLESGFRLITSNIRCFAINILNIGNSPFMGLIEQGAFSSATATSREISLITNILTESC
jgi:hypothetical protein